MQRVRPTKQTDGWSRLKSPESLLALAERCSDEVELYEYVTTQAMITALSTPRLPNRERGELIHKLWTFAVDRFAILQDTPTLSEKARKARSYIDVFAEACLSAIDHYEYYDPADPNRLV